MFYGVLSHNIAGKWAHCHLQAALVAVLPHVSACLEIHGTPGATVLAARTVLVFCVNAWPRSTPSLINCYEMHWDWYGRDVIIGQAHCLLSTESRLFLTRYDNAGPASCAGQNTPEARNLRSACQHNLAACYYHQAQYSEAIKWCNLVLEGDRANWKALYLRGLAHKSLGDWDRSWDDLSAAFDAAAPSLRQDIMTDRDAAMELREEMEQIKVWLILAAGSRSTNPPFSREPCAKLRVFNISGLQVSSR